MEDRNRRGDESAKVGLMFFGHFMNPFAICFFGGRGHNISTTSTPPCVTLLDRYHSDHVNTWTKYVIFRIATYSDVA